MLVERTACGKVVLPPYGVQKRIAGEDLSRVRGESPEKPKLSYGQGLIRLTGGADKKKKFVNSMSSGGKKSMTLRIVVCHISFLKFEYYTQRRGEAEHAEVFTTQILIITLRSRPLFTSA